MSVTDDFHNDSRPLVADSITGVRSFAVDKLGRLTGLHHKKVWRPGVNTAECAVTGDPVWNKLKADVDRMMAGAARLQMGTAYKPYRPSPPMPATAPDPTPSEPHRAGAKGCSCGFWAYFDGSDDYHDDNSLTAIVRGEGVVTVGSKGFRAEKAEIVALVDPTPEPEPEEEPEPQPWHDRWDEFSDFIYRHDNLTAPLAALCVAAALTTAVYSFFGPLWLAFISFAISVVAITTWGGIGHGMRRHFSSLHNLRCSDKKPKQASLNIRIDVGRGEPVIPDRWEAVRRNYPEVPVYRTLTDALAEHPLTPPPPPEPITPANTPDFWEMDA